MMLVNPWINSTEHAGQSFLSMCVLITHVHATATIEWCVALFCFVRWSTFDHGLSCNSATKRPLSSDNMPMKTLATQVYSNCTHIARSFLNSLSQEADAFTDICHHMRPVHIAKEAIFWFLVFFSSAISACFSWMHPGWLLFHQDVTVNGGHGMGLVASIWFVKANWNVVLSCPNMTLCVLDHCPLANLFTRTMKLILCWPFFDPFLMCHSMLLALQTHQHLTLPWLWLWMPPLSFFSQQRRLLCLPIAFRWRLCYNNMCRNSTAVCKVNCNNTGKVWMWNTQQKSKNRM